MKKTLPDWLKQEIPDMEKIRELKKLFSDSQINTVCQEAHCPNLGKCWQEKTATFMILGKVCTRNCRFCAVASGKPEPLSNDEPFQVAKATAQLGLKYVVITSVTRDDLPDEGATQFANTIEAIRKISPETIIEVLIPDLSFETGNLSRVINAKPDVIGHNIETVKRIFPQVRPQARYQRSLTVLKNIRKADAFCIVKSGFMVGLGETDQEIVQLMQDLYDSKCEVITIGQYLAPDNQKNIPESRFVSVSAFEEYKRQGEKIGLRSVMSGPKVRSSFLAEQGYTTAINRKVYYAAK